MSLSIHFLMRFGSILNSQIKLAVSPIPLIKLRVVFGILCHIFYATQKEVTYGNSEI